MEPGTQFGDYFVERLLARGGMSLVYVARSARLDRMVALKVMSPSLSEDPVFRRRFIHEYEQAAAIDHPNVIPIYDAGEHGGQLFIAMRLVDGVDLRTLMKREAPLRPERAAPLLSQAAASVDAVHRAG